MKRKKSKQDRYITKLAKDLKAFRAKEIAGEYISPQERRNIKARERRAMEKMKKTAEPLLEQANQTLRNLESANIQTLSAQRVYDTGRLEFSFENAKTYNDIVEEITLASSFLNSSDTAKLTGERYARNRKMNKKYKELKSSLKDKSYIEKGLIPTEEDAKEIFRTYRKIEEQWAGLIGKQGERGVYGSENLILYIIDVYNRGLDAELYGMQAMENFSLERLPEYQELFQERNKITGISGLFTQKGKAYGKLAGLL